MNLDKILKSFNKTIDKLNKFAEVKTYEATRNFDAAAILNADAHIANSEALRAKQISSKINDLISGE